MAKNDSVSLTSIANRTGNDQLLFNTYILEDISAKPLYVCQSGVKNWRSAGWISGPAIYDHYIFHFIIDGKGTFTCGNQQYPLQRGDMFLINPYTEVYYQADNFDPYRYYWVGFHGTECQELLMKSGFSKDHLVVRCGKPDEIEHNFKKIAAIRSWSPSDQYHLLSYLYHIFASMIANGESVEHRNSDYYYNAVAYIRKNAHRAELTVATVAQQIGIDRTHLYRIFKENSQHSVKEFITLVRIEKAKLFLTNTDHSIELVASYSGFADSSHFTQIFRKYEGCTPTHYRNQQKTNGSGI